MNSPVCVGGGERIALFGLAASAPPQIRRRRPHALLVFGLVRSFGDVSYRLTGLVRELARIRAPSELLRLRDESFRCARNNWLRLRIRDGYYHSGHRS